MKFIGHKNKFAIYHMNSNSFLGDCTSVVYRPSKKEITNDHLLVNHLLVIIKSRVDLKKLLTIEDIRKANIFVNDKPVLLRLSSECLFSSFGDTHCDCESQRICTLREIHKYGEGIFIHIPQEAQGNGLFYKAMELELQVNGFLPDGKFVGQKSVTEAAKLMLGDLKKLDKRKYLSIKTVFESLNLRKYKFALMSENPKKKKFLEKILGVKISSTYKVKGHITIENIGEYLSKLYSKSFVLSDEELKDIYGIINSSKEIPERAASVLRFISEDIKLGKHFNANGELLEHLIGLLNIKKKRELIQGLDLFQDSEAYEEYHTELRIDTDGLEKLFKSGILISDELLRYEENFFYDLPYFSLIPCRTLKIRKAFKLNDLKHPLQCELIYKIPIKDKNNLIKCIGIDNEDIINLIDVSLKDYNVHALPVFTHKVVNKSKNIKTLIKRYSHDLRVLSLMGEKNEVDILMNEINKLLKTSEINILSDQSHANAKTPTNFNWNKLALEETNFYKKYFIG